MEKSIREKVNRNYDIAKSLSERFPVNEEDIVMEKALLAIAETARKWVGSDRGFRKYIRANIAKITERELGRKYFKGKLI